MAGIRDEIDAYGFQRDEDFDFDSFESFMSTYLKILARRSSKWEHLLKGTSKLSRSKKVKRYIRKGVPSDLRGEVWLELSGAKERLENQPNLYKDLVQNADDAAMIELIERDVTRTFPENIHFRSKDAGYLSSLKNVLVAYAHYNKTIGYCQGLNYIVGMLLLVSKSEAKTFWLLVELVERLPDFYSAGMRGLKVECRVLKDLLRTKESELQDHLTKNGVDYELPISKWFICLFMDVLPVETVLRIWDCVFYEGSKILLRVAFTLIVLHKEQFLAADDFVKLYNIFKSITNDKTVLYCHNFLQQCFTATGSFPLSKIKALRTKFDEEVDKERPNGQS